MFKTLHYGKIKRHGFKMQDRRRVPIVKIERRFKHPIGTKNRRNCFIVSDSRILWQLSFRGTRHNFFISCVTGIIKSSNMLIWINNT